MYLCVWVCMGLGKQFLMPDCIKGKAATERGPLSLHFVMEPAFLVLPNLNAKMMASITWICPTLVSQVCNQL